MHNCNCNFLKIPQYSAQYQNKCIQFRATQFQSETINAKDWYRSDADRLVNHHGRMEEVKGEKNNEEQTDKTVNVSKITKPRVGSAKNGWMSPQDFVADFNG